MTTQAIDMASDWRHYDRIAQSYRLYAAVVLGGMMASGMAALAVSTTLSGVLLVAAAVIHWGVVFPAVFARHAIVDFHKHGYADRLNPDGSAGHGLTVSSFANTGPGNARRAAYATLGAGSKVLGPTRLRFDVGVPAAVLSVWAIILLLA